MTTIESQRAIIVEPRKCLAEVLQKCLHRKILGLDASYAHSIEEALELAFRISLKKPRYPDSGGTCTFLFLLGGNCYTTILLKYGKVAACFPNSKFILLDDHPRVGCSVLADRLTLHGCLSLYDSQEDCLRCFESVVEGRPAMTASARRYLMVDEERKVLASRKELRKQVPFSLSEKEWVCFQHLIAGNDVRELGDLLRLQPRSARNLKYRMMAKFGVSKFVDILWAAHQWGLLQRDSGSKMIQTMMLTLNLQEAEDV